MAQSGGILDGAVSLVVKFCGYAIGIDHDSVAKRGGVDQFVACLIGRDGDTGIVSGCEIELRFRLFRADERPLVEVISNDRPAIPEAFAVGQCFSSRDQVKLVVLKHQIESTVRVGTVQRDRLIDGLEAVGRFALQRTQPLAPLGDAELIGLLGADIIDGQVERLIRLVGVEEVKLRADAGQLVGHHLKGTKVAFSHPSSPFALVHLI